MLSYCASMVTGVGAPIVPMTAIDSGLEIEDQTPDADLRRSSLMLQPLAAPSSSSSEMVEPTKKLPAGASTTMK